MKLQQVLCGISHSMLGMLGVLLKKGGSVPLYTNVLPRAQRWLVSWLLLPLHICLMEGMIVLWAYLSTISDIYAMINIFNGRKVVYSSLMLHSFMMIVSRHCTIGFNYDNYDFFLLWKFTLIVRFIHVITFHILNLATRCICMRTTWVGGYLVVFGFENDFPSHRLYILLLFLYLLRRLKCCHK